jgi:spermidine/putrescine transport system permease protein
MKRSRVPFVAMVAVLAFFYLPLAVLVINSFNASRFGGTWEGLSLKWYADLFGDRDVWTALRNTAIVGLSAMAVSAVIGTCAAFALHRYHSRLQRAHYALICTPLVVPDILMGISLLLFFASLGVGLSLLTVFLAHVTFCISFVAMVVLARLQDFDFSLVEAAQDLGAGWWTTARRVVLPLLAPGIAAGALLALTLSIDDLVITFFVCGPGSTTLPVRIYSMMKHSKHMPIINALSTLLLAVTFAAAWGSQRLQKGR